MTQRSQFGNPWRSVFQLVVFAVALLAAEIGINAQSFRFSDGNVARCTTFAGRIAEQIYLPSGTFLNMGYTGTTIALPDGSARITWDTGKLNSLPIAAHDFIYFHECAHAHVPTSDELMANCVGLIDMREAGRSSPQVEEDLRRFHASLGFMGPRYGVGSDYWNKTVQCANRGAPQTRFLPSASTTTTCSFTFGPMTGRIIDFANRQGVIPVMVGSPCTDGAGSFGVAVPNSASVVSSGIEGEWRGTLSQWNLPIVLHLESSGIGSADSPSQNAYGIPLRYTVTNNRLRIEIPSVAATYTSSVNDSQMLGTFNQNGQNIRLVLAKAHNSDSAGENQSNGIEGDWTGVLAGTLPLIVHLNGIGTGTIDSPRQNAFGMSVRYTIRGRQVTMTISRLRATFSGTLNGSLLNGVFTQNGRAIPFQLARR